MMEGVTAFGLSLPDHFSIAAGMIRWHVGEGDCTGYEY
jgi:hypothetical protein